MSSANSLSGLMKWLQREEWREPFTELLTMHAGRACAEAGVAFEDLPNFFGDDRFAILWGCVFEDFLASELEDGHNIVDDYLRRRGWNESVSNKRYMRALRASTMSLYEISDIVRDQGFLARDMVRGGDPVRVNEKSGTRSLKQWDRIAVRIVQLGSRMEMSGGALPFDRNASDAILDAIRRTGADEAAIADALRSCAFIFTDAWLGGVLRRALHPTLPRLHNGDGEDIEWTTASYPLTAAAKPAAIKLALAGIPALRPASRSFWNWIGWEEPRGAKPRGEGQTFVTTLDDGSNVLGTIELKKRTLILEANSPERARRGRALIEPVLADLIGRPAVESTTVAEMMASRPKGTPKARSSSLPPEEEHAILRAFMDEHYRNAIDEPIAMLGNISPRQAVTSAEGRRKVVEWLKLIENGTARNTTAAGGYDPSWMWDELGVAELRR